MDFLLRFPRKRNHPLRNFDFGAVGIIRDLHQFEPAELPALIFHRRVGTRRILPQNLVEQNQGLDHVLPGRLADVAETAYANPKV